MRNAKIAGKVIQIVALNRAPNTDTTSATSGSTTANNTETTESATPNLTRMFGGTLVVTPSEKNINADCLHGKMQNT